MFLSKIWILFTTLITVLTMGAIMVATKPAEFFLKQAYKNKVIDLFQGTFEREMEVESRHVLDTLSLIRMDARIIGALKKGESNKSLVKIIKKYQEKINVDFLIPATKEGSLVVKNGKLPFKSVAGFPIFKESQKGFHSDNTMNIGKDIYQVFSVPVLSSDKKSIVGSLVALRKLDVEVLNDFLDRMGYGNKKSRNVEIAVFSKNKPLYFTKDQGIWSKIPAVYKETSKEIRDSRLGFSSVKSIKFGEDEFGVILSMIRGSVTNPLYTPDKKIPQMKDNGIFFVVAWRLPLKMGPFAFLDKVIPQDKLMEGFPWVVFILATLIFLIFGIMVIVWEGDLPMKRMINSVKSVSADEFQLINDENFGGKFGSLARAINEALEHAAANASPDAQLHQKSMDDILGGEGGEFEGPKASLPDGGPPPPPLTGKPLKYPALTKNKRSDEKKANLPPLPRTNSSESVKPVEKPVEKAVVGEKDNISGLQGSPEPGPEPPIPGEDPTEYFTYILNEFKALKMKVEGSLDGFNDKSFIAKLQKSTDGIREKSKCEQVVLTVYERDGKAGLKAAPKKI